MGEVNPLFDVGGLPRTVGPQFEIHHLSLNGKSGIFDLDLLLGDREKCIGFGFVASCQPDSRHEQQGGRCPK